jgi:imidazolonepropionase-like amidohydrolase
MHTGSFSRRDFIAGFSVATLGICAGCTTSDLSVSQASTAAYANGRWFNGSGFAERTLYSVGQNFSTRRPHRVDRVMDLAGTWVIPPFGDAHNHSIGTGVDATDRLAVERYLSAGVFYAKMQGNLPLSLEQKHALGLNSPTGLDVAFANGTLTAPGGWPKFLIEKLLLPQGYFPGHTPQTLADHRYFTVGSADELDAKWPLMRAQGGDFVKIFLWFSDEFEKRKGQPQSGLDPRLVPLIVRKAHDDGLRVSAHAWNAADFRTAITAGVDEIAHLPPFGLIEAADAALAASRGVVVVTTARLIQTLPPTEMPKNELGNAIERQRANLQLLKNSGVRIAIGSDLPQDTSTAEVDYLRQLGVFTDAELLAMWSQLTPQTIFPARRIGQFADNHEASFLALEGNPLEDWRNTTSIRYRVKQAEFLAT